MYFVYALFNKKHSKIYIGQTDDIGFRIKAHNDHLFRNSYTARFDGEWVKIYDEKCDTRSGAIKREKQLKSYRGREFIKGRISKK